MGVATQSSVIEKCVMCGYFRIESMTNPILTAEQERDFRAKKRGMTLALSDYMDHVQELRYVLVVRPDQTGTLVAPVKWLVPATQAYTSGQSLMHGCPAPPLPNVELNQSDCEKLSTNLRRLPRNNNVDKFSITWPALGFTDPDCLYFAGWS